MADQQTLHFGRELQALVKRTTPAAALLAGLSGLAGLGGVIGLAALATAAPTMAAPAESDDAAGTASGATSRQWNFEVTLNDSPIGRHQFSLRRQGDTSRLVGQANFDVKLLFINAYRYRHKVTETWQGDCLSSMEASTDDDGKTTTVTARAEQDALKVKSPQGDTRLNGCVMSFAYWNPAFLKQTRLLNSQTGKYQDVSITALPDETLSVRNTSVKARHYRLTGTDQPIELWYSADGDWLGLRTVVGGDKVLRYRPS